MLVVSIWAKLTLWKILSKFFWLSQTWSPRMHMIYCNPKMFVFLLCVLVLPEWHISGWPEHGTVGNKGKSMESLVDGKDKLFKIYLSSEDSELNCEGGFKFTVQIISVLKFCSNNMKGCAHEWWNIYPLGMFLAC